MLVDDMHAGRVQTLVVLGGNPVYDAPSDFRFAQALARVPFSVHFGLYDDETAARTTWHAPHTHFLEHWSDAGAPDGTASIVQPVIAPLYGGVSPHDVLSILARDPMRRGYDVVRSHWRAQAGGDFEASWGEWLRRGKIEGTSSGPLSLSVRKPAAPLRPAPTAVWSLRFHGDESVRAGEYANNAWLQELPRPHTKLTWDNAALIGPASARELAVATGDVVEIDVEGRALSAPVWVMPGHPERSISVALGYGRARAGRIGNGVGFDAYRVRVSSAPWSAAAQVRKTGTRRHAFATTQNHDRMEGRDQLRRGSLAQFLTDPGRFKRQEDNPTHTLYPQWPTPGYHWGMSIDLTACIGCNACTIACQSENNIPTVGRKEVMAGREMHWIRIDRYFEGPAESPKTLFMPVPCMHCENAPCEYVCPVEASIHDSEGLNLQVYNRCVGTRFCSQNCPYKVRRFNFLQYADRETESLKAGRNPQVTVRERGVMEKCTYCVQRITRARIEAEKRGRRIADGEVVTACQAVCPTQAIVFGDTNDPASRVVAAKASPLEYPLLGELNTRPSTTYLARLDNPDPDLDKP
jgi:molybdopterin-containing oxidoreductase family iron-sulfur binding subunit